MKQRTTRLKRTVLVISLLALGTGSASAQSFTQIAPSIAVRADFTSTALVNGLVLNTGGWSAGGGGCPGRSGAQSSTETFDPATETFTAAGNMATPRWEHSAIRLNDGRVLVAGGATACVTNMTASAELYEPASRTFAPTGSMTLTRKAFPMALEDGTDNVLVFGGTVEGSFASATNLVERWDAITGVFSVVGTMVEARGEHGVCPLGTGNYLLVGGNNHFSDGSPARSRTGEIFSTNTGTSRLLVAQTTFPHQNNVSAARMPDGRCMIASEANSGLVAEIFDPVTESFTAIPSIPGYDGVLTFQSSVTMLPDGNVLLSPNPTTIYHPADGSVTSVPIVANMPRHSSQAVALPSGDVLISGGASYADGLPIRDAFIFTAATESGLTFPLAGKDAQTALVTAVFDHHGNAPNIEDGVITDFAGNTYLCTDNQMRIYDPATGQYEYPVNVANRCAKLTANTVPLKRVFEFQAAAPISLPGMNFVNDDQTYISYDGHTGTDFPGARGDAIVAAHDGILCAATKKIKPVVQDPQHPWRDVTMCPVRHDEVNNNRNPNVDSWNHSHTFYIVGANGMATWYLHADALASDVLAAILDHGYASVIAGAQVATVGGFFKREPDGVHPHLHFEVRIDGVTRDPYATPSMWAPGSGIGSN